MWTCARSCKHMCARTCLYFSCATLAPALDSKGVSGKRKSGSEEGGRPGEQADKRAVRTYTWRAPVWNMRTNPKGVMYSRRRAQTREIVVGTSAAQGDSQMPRPHKPSTHRAASGSAPWPGASVVLAQWACSTTAASRNSSQLPSSGMRGWGAGGSGTVLPAAGGVSRVREASPV